MILGITGTDGAGKGTVVEYLLAHKGFIHYSARAIFVEALEKRGIENNRANIRIVANELRREYGNDFVVTSSLQKAEAAGHKNIVIDSVRTIAEAEALKRNDGILLCVDADQKARYERIKKRGSSTDHVSFEEFSQHEAMEMNDPDPNGMQKAMVIKMADYTIRNDVSLEDLAHQVETFFAKFCSLHN